MRLLQAVSEDEIDVSLSITTVQQRHYRTYVIRAVNVIGEKATSIRLVHHSKDVVTTALPFTTAEMTSLPLQLAETTSVGDGQNRGDPVELNWDEQDELVLSDRQQSMLNDEAVVVVGENAPGYQLTSSSTFSVSSSNDVTTAVVNSTGQSVC